MKREDRENWYFRETPRALSVITWTHRHRHLLCADCDCDSMAAVVRKPSDLRELVAVTVPAAS